MKEQLDLVALFEGLSLEEAKDLTARIRSAVDHELETSRNPNRVREKVERVYGEFTQELHAGARRKAPDYHFSKGA